ncbi:hypothetical protein [Streptomyces sp. NBC_00328]|nr:hypothetical protein [Streptomyces sp. NBC_00328]
MHTCTKREMCAKGRNRQDALGRTARQRTARRGTHEEAGRAGRPDRP